MLSLDAMGFRENKIGDSRMSWHHGDWLSFAQAAASTLAVAGAFGVVFFQHWIHVRHTGRVEERDRLRERYRSATYAEALVQNAIDCAVPALHDIETVAKRSPEKGNVAFDASRLDKASDALEQAIHNQLPTEITNAVLSAWMAAQQFCHALHRTEEIQTMNMEKLLAYCREQYSVLNSSMEVVRLSKTKWERRLAEE
ncbi:MAG: hypothetical protein EPN70_13335 [Paraburkholderia sp.]|uniref:hypothetical protein n=1 Tax=Paraburkholderia sp. TaxID=1926495 RepID=UPI00122222A3|nr:hypothetical protein [Paraburkholderia sp.]TAM03707.1 MAG: hypothetical protein EPN70_13335 [Paraburkholderia sp.]